MFHRTPIGRMYTATLENITQSTEAWDVFAIVGASDSITIVHNFEITQSSDPNIDQQINILVHLALGSGSGTISITPTPHNLGDPSFGGTVQRSSISAGGEGTHIFSANWNILNGYRSPHLFRYNISSSDRFHIKLQNLSGSMTFSAFVILEEIGG